MKNDPGKDAAYARCVVALLVPAALLNHLDRPRLAVRKLSVIAKVGVEVEPSQWPDALLTARQVGQLRGEPEPLRFPTWIRS